MQIKELKYVPKKEEKKKEFKYAIFDIHQIVITTEEL
jgi:hypothetical protein